MATPATTLFPLASLPACAGKCGVLYDVNGKCVPPNVPAADASVYDACFCNDARLTPWRDAATDLCKGACAATSDLGSIRGWYTDFCNGKDAAVPTANPGGSPDSGTSPSTSTANNNGGGGTWLSSHYQWVVFLVVVVVGIAGVWIGTCLWRRHYLAKKDRQYALGKNLARATESGRVVPNTSAGSVHLPGPGVFTPAPIASAGVYDLKVKKEKKKWVVKERT